MKVIILAGKGTSTKYIYNGICENVHISSILLTNPIGKKKLIKGRIKRLGYLHVFNQLLFQVVFLKLMRITSKSLIARRIKELGLNNKPLPKDKIIEVGFVNSDKCIKVIQEINPDIIIVNGTSIISSKVLESTNAIFINTHVGITPQYRGVHGGYWSLRNNDKENFGVTVHIVDKGIDTGGIIYQDTCEVKEDDNFLTYPLYQYSIAIPLLIRTIDDIKTGDLRVFKKEKVESKLYYHPTLTQYIYSWLKNGIK